MNTELQLTEENGVWTVWFTTIFDGRRSLESFDNLAEAQAYYNEQLESAE